MKITYQGTKVWYVCDDKNDPVKMQCADFMTADGQFHSFPLNAETDPKLVQLIQNIKPGDSINLSFS